MLYTGLNVLVLILMLVVPVIISFVFLKFLKTKEKPELDMEGRILMLEKKVKELEDYINSFDV